MANGNSLFSFLAGMAVGTVISVLAFTERGHEFMQEVKKKGEGLFDKAVSRMESDPDLDDFGEEL